MKRPIQTDAVAATSDAARTLDTSQKHVRGLPQRSSGHSDGSITIAHLAVNMNGAAVRLVNP